MDNIREKDIFLFNLGLAELISYYKLACPKTVILKAGCLDDAQKEFWKKLFYNGLGEFRFINNIDIKLQKAGINMKVILMQDVKALGKKDHTTVIHGIDRITEEIQTNDELKNRIDIIMKKINPS